LITVRAIEAEPNGSFSVFSWAGFVEPPLRNVRSVDVRPDRRPFVIYVTDNGAGVPERAPRRA